MNTPQDHGNGESAPPATKSAKLGKHSERYLTPEMRRELNSTTSQNSALAFMRAFFKIAKPYWTSKASLPSWGLLVGVIAIMLGEVGLALYASNLNGEWIGHLQGGGHPDSALDVREGHQSAFWHIIYGILPIVAMSQVASGSIGSYMQKEISLRWRENLTDDLLKKWLDPINKPYQRLISIYQNSALPEQRIEMDPEMVTEKLVETPIKLLQALITVPAFGAILYALDPLLLWGLFAYMGIANLGGLAVGKPFVHHSKMKEHFSAAFRSAIGRIKDNADSVAFLGGEQAEMGELRRKFKPVSLNWRNLMKTRLKVDTVVGTQGELAVILPYTLVAPAWFSGKIGYAGVGQAMIGFMRANHAMTIIVRELEFFSKLVASTQRLAGFMDAIEQSNIDLDHNRKLTAQQEAFERGEDVEPVLKNLPPPIAATPAAEPHHA